MKIAFDVDGVVCDSFRVLRQAILEEFGFDVGKGIREYTLTVPGVPLDVLKQFIRAVMAEYAEKMVPYEGIVDDLIRFRKETGPLHFVTARPPSVIPQTTTWLHRIFGKPFFVENVPSAHKARYLSASGVNVFVEDRYRTACDCASEGVFCYLVSRPWNEGRQVPLFVRRVLNVQEALEDVLRRNSYADT